MILKSLQIKPIERRVCYYLVDGILAWGRMALEHAPRALALKHRGNRTSEAD